MGLLTSLRRFRDAVTGKFVSRLYAEKHPRTTVSERVDPWIRPTDPPEDERPR